MRGAAAGACAACIPLIILAAAWVGERRSSGRQGMAFVVPAPTNTLLVNSHAPTRDRTVLKATAAFEGSTAARCALGGAALALLAGTIGRRKANPQPRSRITMYRRGQKPFRPNAKGQKPMIARPITRDIMMENMNAWRKRYKGAGEIEDIMKKTLYGRVQFQFSSQVYTDDEPIVPAPGTRPGGRRNRDEEDTLTKDALLEFKYKRPARFKKLAIVNWEVPADHTPSVTLQELIDAGVQYGHASGIWNPEMLKYLYSDFDGTHIFDLVQTAAMINRTCYYCMEAATKGAKFLFVGTKQQARKAVFEAADRTKQMYCDKYTGGLLTNFYQVKKGIDKFKRMRVEKAQGAWKSESETQQKSNELAIIALEKKYKGVSSMKFLPDLVIFVDENKERGLVNECTRLGIPMIGMLDSNSRPKHIDLPIPGNTSGSKSIELVMSKITEAIVLGQQKREEQAVGDTEEIPKTWDPWIFSRDRMRQLRRRSKRQPWHKTLYGGYDQFQKANPYGRIPLVPPFDPDFRWPKPPGIP